MTTRLPTVRYRLTGRTITIEPGRGGQVLVARRDGLLVTTLPGGGDLDAAARAAADERDATYIPEAPRTHLCALADYLTSLPSYPDPWEMVHALVPWVPLPVVEQWFGELLHLATYPGIARADQHWLGEVLDYLTGAR